MQSHKSISPIIVELESRFRESGMSLSELGRRAKVPPFRLNEYFRGKRVHPPIDTIERIAAALGVRIRLEPVADPLNSSGTAGV
jgi:transcriptional regulator with XRE-family HTH domain